MWIYIFKILRFLAVLSFAVMLASCTVTKTESINTNQFLQTDYNYNCLDGTKTFTQIIVCYQEQDAAEKAQNKITNELINK